MNRRDRGGHSCRSLRHVRAAQLRARVITWAIGKCLLGTMFLVGALSYAFGPERASQSSRLWMAALVVMSVFNVGLGLRTLARVAPVAARFWWLFALAWGVLSTVLLRILLHR